MSNIAIRVVSLSKEFRIGDKQENYKTLRDSLSNVALGPFRAIQTFVQRKGDTSSNQRIWALKDVSFEVSRGEVVGIIGRNGAGKSTLLKILSRITHPTKGSAEITGRVGSLLEVGTGFHPELTGRENIYLNGAILGMKRTEIDRKFDEIVDFAEVEKFIDTPIKHYSSGMYVRLAFAVAAHLDTEILLVDEVLSVGDMAFQRKCLGRINQVSHSGRTVIFISHNMSVVESLCDRVIYLERGLMEGSGTPSQMIPKYFSGDNEYSYEKSILQAERPSKLSDELRFTYIKICDETGECFSSINVGQDFYVFFSYVVTRPISDALVALRIETLWGQILVDTWDRDTLTSEQVQEGQYNVKVHISPQDLHPGDYQISLVAAVHKIKWLDKVDAALIFSVKPFTTNKTIEPERHALLYKQYNWSREHTG
jgi:lipopolysaccharide transport system ATP-binding protein